VTGMDLLSPTTPAKIAQKASVGAKSTLHSSPSRKVHDSPETPHVCRLTSFIHRRRKSWTTPNPLTKTMKPCLPR
jgi:hypothetical protein